MLSLRILLWPFSLLYGSILLLRNKLFDAGWLTSVKFDLPVISVGNLTVGGTGKTPHVEYFFRLLAQKQLAVLSRGYRRKTKGFVLADAAASAYALGDEPYQYYRDFPEVTVAVCESRPAGIAELLRSRPSIEVVILDDAMQHRPVQPSFNLMLTDYGRPFFEDLVLPAGLLREPRRGAKRADAIIVSKCPADMAASEMDAYIRQVRRYSRPAVPVFFSGFRYGQAIPIGSAKHLCKRIVLLTGIANAAPLLDYLTHEGYDIVQHLDYPDHYHYTLEDVEKVQRLLGQDESLCVLTTRKDAVKLTDAGLQKITHALPLFYMPIEVYFLREQDAFNALIKEHIASFTLA